MIVGFIFIGTLTALLSATGVLLASGSVWMAALAYSGTGLAFVVLMCLAAVLLVRENDETSFEGMSF